RRGRRALAGRRRRGRARERNRVRPRRGRLDDGPCARSPPRAAARCRRRLGQQVVRHAAGLADGRREGERVRARALRRDVARVQRAEDGQRRADARAAAALGLSGRRVPMTVTARTEVHPLDPLTPDEIRRAVELVRAERPGTLRFVSVSLYEPDKADLAMWPDGRLARKSEVVAVQPDADSAFEALVDLDAGGVETLRVLDAQQPAVVPEE